MDQTSAIFDIIFQPSYALRIDALNKWREADELTDRILYLYEQGMIDEVEAAEMWHEVEDLQVEACELDDAYEMVYEMEHRINQVEVN